MRDNVKICPHCSEIMNIYQECIAICPYCSCCESAKSKDKSSLFAGVIDISLDNGESFVLDNKDETKYFKWFLEIKPVIHPDDELFDKDRI